MKHYQVLFMYQSVFSLFKHKNKCLSISTSNERDKVRKRKILEITYNFNVISIFQQRIFKGKLNFNYRYIFFE